MIGEKYIKEAKIIRRPFSKIPKDNIESLERKNVVAEEERGQCNLSLLR